MRQPGIRRRRRDPAYIRGSGTWYDGKAAEAAERDRPVARVINVTSVSGIYGNVGQTNYGAAKAGIAGFTFIASLELARFGATVNALREFNSNALLAPGGAPVPFSILFSPVGEVARTDVSSSTSREA